MSNRTPLISTLICTYNAVEFFDATIRSVLDQTYTNQEILIRDDCSTDKTVALLQERAQKDSRIRLFIDPGVKRGPYGGLNHLLDHAKGKYVAIQDHDDIWHPEKLQKQVDFLERNKEYVGCGTATRMYYEGDQYEFTYYLGKKTTYTLHPSLVFRKTNKRYDLSSSYMVDAHFQTILLCEKQAKIHNLLQVYTTHIIKAGAQNHSYKRFQYNRATLKRIYAIHPLRYATFILWRETMRKVLYPFLLHFGLARYIDPIERLPFRLLGYKIRKFTLQEASSSFPGK